MNEYTLQKVRSGFSTLFVVSTVLIYSCAEKQQPNILFIMSDDHACQAISAYNGNLNQTPNIDRLASEGIRFENSFCTNAICAPSRAVMLTGKHSHLNKHIDNNKAFDGSQTTFPKILQQNGYQTAMIGKWHLVSEPTGFDYWNILPGQGSYYNPDFIEMGETKRIKGYVTDLITDSALEWLDEHDNSKPFCLLLHHKAPHRNWMPNIKHLNLYKDEDIPSPDNLFDDFRTRTEALKTQEINIDRDLFLDYDFKVPLPDNYIQSEDERSWSRSWELDYNRLSDIEKQAWDDAYNKENQEFLEANLKGEELKKWKYQRYIKDYLRCIASVDENVGRVLTYLEKNGLVENTIVVYTSDQGFFLGEHGLFDKRFMYEESFRMPLIIRYPKEVTPSVNNENLVQNLDFAPTFLDYAGIPIPEEMQGKSIRQVSQGKTVKEWRKAVYFHFYEYPSIGMVKRHYGIRSMQFKLIHFYHDIDTWELFDLEKDPGEMKNVYNNPAYADIRVKIEEKLIELRDYYGDTDEQQFMPKPVTRVKHSALGFPVSLKDKPAKKYNGGTPNALTDGLRAPDQLNGYGEHSVWQGFEEIDLEATIDLKHKKSVTSISLGCLQQISAWIFLPLDVKISISSDGNSFKTLAYIKNTIPEKKPNCFRYEFTWQGEPVETRFIKVFAKNRGICPDWHNGTGGRAWIFADEIEVQ